MAAEWRAREAGLLSFCTYRSISSECVLRKARLGSASTARRPSPHHPVLHLLAFWTQQPHNTAEMFVGGRGVCRVAGMLRDGHRPCVQGNPVGRGGDSWGDDMGPAFRTKVIGIVSMNMMQEPTVRTHSDIHWSHTFWHPWAITYRRSCSTLASARVVYVAWRQEGFRLSW